MPGLFEQECRTRPCVATWGCAIEHVRVLRAAAAEMSTLRSSALLGTSERIALVAHAGAYELEFQHRAVGIEPGWIRVRRQNRPPGPIGGAQACRAVWKWPRETGRIRARELVAILQIELNRGGIGSAAMPTQLRAAGAEAQHGNRR